MVNNFINKEEQVYIPGKEKLELVGRALVHYLANQKSDNPNRKYAQTGYTVLCKQLGISYAPISKAISAHRKGNKAASVSFHVAVKLLRAFIVRSSITNLGQAVVFNSPKQGIMLDISFDQYGIYLYYQSNALNDPLSGTLNIYIEE